MHPISGVCIVRASVEDMYVLVSDVNKPRSVKGKANALNLTIKTDMVIKRLVKLRIKSESAAGSYVTKTYSTAHPDFCSSGLIALYTHGFRPSVLSQVDRDHARICRLTRQRNIVILNALFI